jgi:hypothetical protein
LLLKIREQVPNGNRGKVLACMGFPLLIFAEEAPCICISHISLSEEAETGILPLKE